MTEDFPKLDTDVQSLLDLRLRQINDQVNAEMIRQGWSTEPEYIQANCYKTAKRIGVKGGVRIIDCFYHQQEIFLVAYSDLIAADEKLTLTQVFKVDKDCCAEEDWLTSWICHVCKEERPDRFISVYKTDLSDRHKLPVGTITQNVRYCNDRQDCISKAPSIILGD